MKNIVLRANIIAIISWLIPLVATSHEINTHFVLTVGTQENGNSVIGIVNKSDNLKDFIEIFSLSEKEYSLAFIKEAEVFTQALSVEIKIGKATAYNLIGAGAILEDHLLRFLNHFYDPTRELGFSKGFFDGMIARDWAYKGWIKALGHYKEAITSTPPAQRENAEENLFLTLGKVVHLLQDMTQPAHTRNDAHGGRWWLGGESALEEFGKKFLSVEKFNKAIAAKINAAEPEYFPIFNDYYDETAKFSNKEFFSDDTIFASDLAENDEDFYAFPNRQLTTISNGYVNNANLVKLAMLNRSDISFPDEQIHRKHFILSKNSDTSVLIDNAKELLPVASARCAGLLNHFFRGRIEISFDPSNPSQLQIKNISDVTLAGNDPENVIFSDGAFSIFYKTEETELIYPIMGFQEINFEELEIIILGKNEVATIEGDIRGAIADVVSKHGIPAFEQGDRIVVFYSGIIGQEPGVAATTSILSENMPPEAVRDNDMVATNGTVMIKVLDNDSDPEDGLDEESVAICVSPQHGVVSVNPATGVVTYESDAGYDGFDHFIYSVSDIRGLIAYALVRITVGEKTEREKTGPIEDYYEEKEIDKFTADVIDGINSFRFGLAGVEHIDNNSNIEIQRFDDNDGAWELDSVDINFETEYDIEYSQKDSDNIYSHTEPDTFGFGVVTEIEAIASIGINFSSLLSSPSFDPIELFGRRDEAGELIEDFSKSSVLRSLSMSGIFERGKTLRYPRWEETIFLPDVEKDLYSFAIVLRHRSYAGLATRTNFRYYDSSTGELLGTSASTNFPSHIDNGLLSSSWTNTITMTYHYLEYKPPIAEDDNVSTLAGIPTPINVLCNDYDNDDMIIEGITIVNYPKNGSVDKNVGGGDVIYQANDNFTGEDTFSYTIEDERGLVSEPAQVIVNVIEPTCL